jgi:hypothetical protein
MKFDKLFKALAKEHGYTFMPPCSSSGAWLVNEGNDRVVAENNSTIIGWQGSGLHVELSHDKVAEFLKG